MSYFDIYRNCSPKYDEWEEILNHYQDYVEDEDIWKIARESKELPILGNIYQNLVLDRIISHFCDETGVEEEDLDIFLFINSIDTHLVINGWDICTVADYWGCIDKFKKK
ncbi:hypothetical protein ACFFHT_08895 [Gallibacterium melopsittaci]|uniref:Uncharacterized protein n=1 Tax=Gallibacterium melopsittaci TaxID=516063 RepID=A0ABV6HXQ9_9PAST